MSENPENHDQIKGLGYGLKSLQLDKVEPLIRVEDKRQFKKRLENKNHVIHLGNNIQIESSPDFRRDWTKERFIALEKSKEYLQTARGLNKRVLSLALEKHKKEASLSELSGKDHTSLIWKKNEADGYIPIIKRKKFIERKKIREKTSSKTISSSTVSNFNNEAVYMNADFDHLGTNIQPCTSIANSGNISDINSILEQNDDEIFPPHSIDHNNFKWIFMNSIVNVQLVYGQRKTRCEENIEDSQSGKNIPGFVVRVQDLISREKKIYHSSTLNALHQSTEPEKDFCFCPINGLILRKVIEVIVSDMSKKDNQNGWKNIQQMGFNQRASQNVQRKRMYSITINLLREFANDHTIKCVPEWSGYLTDCIRTYYNTGFIRISKQCDPSQVLLALRFFGIESEPHEFLFESSDSYIAMKPWIKYLHYREEMENFIIRKLQSMQTLSSHFFYISSVRNKGNLFIENQECEHFDGEFELHSGDEEDGLNNSCAVISYLFSDSPDFQISVPLRLQNYAIMAKLLRQDFSMYLEKMLPGTEVSFSPRIVSSDGQSKTLQKQNRFEMVLCICFGSLKKKKEIMGGNKMLQTVHFTDQNVKDRYTNHKINSSLKSKQSGKEHLRYVKRSGTDQLGCSSVSSEGNQKKQPKYIDENNATWLRGVFGNTTYCELICSKRYTGTDAIAI